MPPTRRKSTQSSARSAQPTLSFNSRAAKVTKPSASSTSTKAVKAAKLSDAISTPVDVSTPEAVADEVVELDGGVEGGLVVQEGRSEVVKKEEKRGSEVEDRARNVSDAQVRRYWKGKEEGRKAPRVHQQGLSIEDKILREFDLSYQYGPSIGIPRSKRWKRAAALKLNPPIEVLAVLLKEEAKKAGSGGMERSQVDELMRGKFGTAD